MVPEFVFIGGANQDWIINASGEEQKACCGGNALYSAVGASLWNDKVGIVTRIDDDFPKSCLDAFNKAGIQVHARFISDKKKNMKPVFYDQNGNRFFRTDDGKKIVETYPSNQVSVFDPEIKDVPDLFWNAKAFHLAPMPLPTQLSFAQALKARNLSFSIDPRPARLGTTYRKLLQLTDFFLPSEAEFSILLNNCSEDDKVKTIFECGPAIIGIKSGSKGVLIIQKNSNYIMNIPIFPSKVKDPTGAGDAFCGGFLTGISETGDALEAALRGNVSASFVIEEFDARHALGVSKYDVNMRYRYLKNNR